MNLYALYLNIKENSHLCEAAIAQQLLKKCFSDPRTVLLDYWLATSVFSNQYLKKKMEVSCHLVASKFSVANLTKTHGTIKSFQAAGGTLKP